MKIAVHISGFLRDAPQTKENYAQFLNRPNDEVDFYVSTWSNYDIDRNTFLISSESIDVHKITHDVFGDQLKGLWVGDIQKYMNNEPPHPNSHGRQYFYDYYPVETLSEYGKSMYPWQQRIVDQWYTIYQSYKINMNYDLYDLVVRLRGDMTFIGKPDIPINDISDGIHTNGFWWSDTDTYDDTGLSPFRISEHLGWGKPHWMRKYFEYYRHLINFIGPLLTLPDKKFHFGSEHMFAYYLLRFPYFKRNLNSLNIHDHDVIVHRHGHNHSNHSGIIDADYYTLTAR
jgi:hypothetical protein